MTAAPILVAVGAIIVIATTRHLSNNRSAGPGLHWLVLGLGAAALIFVALFLARSAAALHS